MGARRIAHAHESTATQNIGGTIPQKKRGRGIIGGGRRKRETTTKTYPEAPQTTKNDTEKNRKRTSLTVDALYLVF